MGPAAHGGSEWFLLGLMMGRRDGRAAGRGFKNCRYDQTGSRGWSGTGSAGPLSIFARFGYFAVKKRLFFVIFVLFCGKISRFFPLNPPFPETTELFFANKIRPKIANRDRRGLFRANS